MRVIETTAHIGSDGLLRLEMAVEQRNQDVRVAVIVESAPGAEARAHRSEDVWTAVRGQLEARGVRVPPAGTVNAGPVQAVELPGISASEMLIGDRR